MKNIETILYTDMKRYALRMCNGNIHDAEDMVQDLAEVIFKNLEFYLNRAYAHLKAIIYHQLKCVRSHRQQYNTAKKRTPVETYNPTTVENDVWGIMQKRELQMALTKITKTQSAYFRLRLDGYNAYEIGAMFSRTPETVYITINTAKKNIIKQLN